MNLSENIIAIGRSRYLYDAIVHLNSIGCRFKAIITEKAYDEYDIKHEDFEELANSLGASFFMTKELYSEEIIEIVRRNNVRVAISANWKYTIKQEFLELFECGILNFHLGSLPDYKGNATVNWTIINGENFINGNIHKMAPSLDSGDIVSRRSIPIKEDSYIGDIMQAAEKIAPSLYEEAVTKVLKDPNACEMKGSVHGLRCYPRLPEDSQINWQDDVESIHRLVRASAHPYKGAFSFLNGEKVIIWRATPYQLADPVLGMPGHVVAVNKVTKNILVICKNGVLEVQEIEHMEKKMAPAQLIKSIRTRFKFNADV